MVATNSHLLLMSLHPLLDTALKSQNQFPKLLLDIQMLLGSAYLFLRNQWRRQKTAEPKSGRHHKSDVDSSIVCKATHILDHVLLQVHY
jgi:hypothetical protein